MMYISYWYNYHSNHFDVKESRNGLMDEFEDTLMRQHVDVGSSSNETVHVLGRADVEEDVYTVDYLLAQN